MALKGSKIVYFCTKVPFLRQKFIENYRLSGQNLSIMILENSSDYRDFNFDFDNLSIMNTIHRQVDDPLTSPDTYEAYIDLMCQFDAKAVSSFLRSKANHYRSEVVLKIVSKHHIKDAQAFLLEQQGRLEEAFEMMKADLEGQIQDVVNDLTQNALLWTRLNSSVVLIIQLIQRSHLLPQLQSSR
jgi:hypothetical protein